MEPWLLLQVWGLAVAMQLMPCQGSRCGHQTAEPGTPNLSLCNPSLTPEVQNLPQSMWGHLGWLKLPLQTLPGDAAFRTPPSHQEVPGWTHAAGWCWPRHPTPGQEPGQPLQGTLAVFPSHPPWFWCLTQAGLLHQPRSGTAGS